MRLPLLLLTTLLAGCGAFAEAANGDGGTPDAGPTLRIDPETIKPGQLNAFELTFRKGPPWKKADCNNTYASEVDTGGTDVIYRSVVYDGEYLVTLTLEATRDAERGERALWAEVVCNRQGKPQLTHSEWGRLYVLEPHQADGGSR